MGWENSPIIHRNSVVVIIRRSAHTDKHEHTQIQGIVNNARSLEVNQLGEEECCQWNGPKVMGRQMLVNVSK